jgi:hypothetical protein
MDCQCTGPGFCPLRGREISAREYAFCACTCGDPAFCTPEACTRRRIRWLNERRAQENLPLLEMPPPGPALHQPADGPGTRLKLLLADLGLHGQEGCGCAGMALQMDRWGVAGCRERRQEILDWLHRQQAQTGWWSQLKAAARAARAGLAFHLDPRDPAAGLLDEALRRAEALEGPPPPPKVAPAAAWVPPPGPGPSGVGLVVGTYGLPRLAELQIRLARSMNGPVPVLIADDGSAAVADLGALEDRYDDVTVWPSPRRRGHYSGDLSAFSKGLHWAVGRGFPWLVKVSQRLLVERPGWLAGLTTALAAGGVAALSQRCRDGEQDLRLRAELMVLDVAVWGRPEVLADLNRARLGRPTEYHLHHLLVSRFGDRWGLIDWLTVDRYARSEGVIWHGSHSEQEFHALAARYGLTLDDAFTIVGWQHFPDWKQG